MFEELSELFIWIHYQKFLHHNRSDSLRELNIMNIHLGFFNLIWELRSKNENVTHHPMMDRNYDLWFSNCLQWGWQVQRCVGLFTETSDRFLETLNAIKYALDNGIDLPTPPTDLISKFEFSTRLFFTA